jgi:hypothetical protein
MLRYFLGLTAGALFAGMIFSPTQAIAQQKSQLVGAWTLVSITQTDKDGKQQEIFGANPKGILMFDGSGQYVQIITRSDTPKFAANSRIKGTPEENSAAVRATTATFGTWTVDEAKKTVTVRYTGSLFPNQVGTDSTRTFSISGDELTVNNPATGSGLISKNVWRRAK